MFLIYWFAQSSKFKLNQLNFSVNAKTSSLTIFTLIYWGSGIYLIYMPGDWVFESQPRQIRVVKTGSGSNITKR